MTIKVMVSGAHGRMGQETVKAVQNASQFQLVGTSDRNDDLAKLIHQHKPDLVVDFSTPESVFKNAEIMIENRVHPVIGTTGLTSDQIATLKKQCDEKKLGGIIAPNFSLGAVLLMKYAADAAKYFSHVEIIELHHDGKADAPSGTAIKAAEMIADNCNNVVTQKPQKENITGSRGAQHKNIPIHAVRLPGLMAHLEVIFGSLGETLTFRHDTINRECYMPGVLLACEKVMKLNQLVYGLENIL